MDRDEALNLLDAKLREYRDLSYREVAARAGGEEVLEVTAPSGITYQIEIHIVWDRAPDGFVRVLGSIDDGTLRGAFWPVCRDLLFSPDGSCG